MTNSALKRGLIPGVCLIASVVATMLPPPIPGILLGVLLATAIAVLRVIDKSLDNLKARVNILEEKIASIENKD